MLSHELHGEGPPVVFVHGLTFSGRTWLPVVERLVGYRSIVVDLPGHGRSAGASVSQSALVSQLRELTQQLGLQRPVLVGHSLGAVPATLYAARHGARAVVNVDQTLCVGDVAPFVAALAAKLEEDFDAAFAQFRAGLRIERIPEPQRALVEREQRAEHELLLAYWRELLERPADLEREVDEALTLLQDPYLALFARRLPAPERRWLTDRLSAIQLEEWPGLGHFPHLVQLDRFMRLLTDFLARLPP